MDKEQLVSFIEKLKDSKRILSIKVAFMHEHNFPLEKNAINEKVRTIDVILDQLEVLRDTETAYKCNFDFK